MKKRVKIIVVIALCILGGVGAAFALTAPLAVELVEVAPQTAQIFFTEEGVFDYRRQQAISPMISGEVTQVLVQEGQLVSEGEVIAVINASDYQLQIEQMRSNVRGIQGQIQSLNQGEQLEREALLGQRGSLVGQLNSLEAQSEEGLEAQVLHMQANVSQHEETARRAGQAAQAAREEFGRDSTQYYNARVQQASFAAQAAASRAQLEALRASGAGLQGQRESVLAQISAIDSRLATNGTAGMVTYFQSMIDATNTSITQMEEHMGRSEITAPVSGRIISLPIADTNFVGAGSVVATIGFDESVEVYIPTRELEGVSVGDEVELILDRRAGSEVVSGRVASLGEMAQVRLSALGVEERRVRALITPAASDLIIGYSMDVRFTVLSLPDSLVVPRTAVFRTSQGVDYLWVQGSDGRVQLRSVERGPQLRDGYVITSGLAPGEVVVRDANQSGLSEGARIRSV